VPQAVQFAKDDPQEQEVLDWLERVADTDGWV